MFRYYEVIEQLPLDVKIPLLRMVELLREELLETVKKSDFDDLKGVVRELAEAQKRTELKVGELAEAQKKTDLKLGELAEAQKRTEARLDSLTQRVEELAEAQKRTELKVGELAEAQKKTEARLDSLTQRVEELAEAQKRTEDALIKLIKEHDKTREILGGLSDTVGYGLEDKIMPYINDFAKKEFAIETTLIERRNIVYSNGRYDEVNIYVEGTKKGDRVYIVGECKARPSKKEIERFMSQLKRIKDYLKAPVYSFIVGYTYSPEVERHLKERYPDLKVMKSFEFELKYERR